MSGPLLPLIEAALNRLLDLDPDLPGDLAALSGRSVGVELTGTGLAWTLYPGPWGLYLRAGIEETPDAVIRGSPLALAALGGEDPGALFGPGVRIEGDSRLADRLRRLLARALADPEEPLARLLGDTLSHPLAAGLRRAGHWLGEARRSLAADAGEYLQEEVRLTPGRAEVDELLAAVDGLRDDVERLDARIARLRRAGDAG